MPADALAIVTAAAAALLFIAYWVGYYVGARDARRAAREALDMAPSHSYYVDRGRHDDDGTCTVTLPPLPEGANAWRIRASL